MHDFVQTNAERFLAMHVLRICDHRQVKENNADFMFSIHIEIQNILNKTHKKTTEGS